MIRKLSLSLSLFFIVFVAVGQINYPNKIRLNEDWEFLRQDLGSIWEAVRPFHPGNPESVPLWAKVSLPHCFNSEDAVDPYVNYYQGPGWYKTLLKIENPYANGRILLEFEGAGQKTDVYIYTEQVGSHVGGYDEWTVDITEAVNRFLLSENAKRFDGKVPLSIRCDNSRDTQLIPSDLSDFNIYGGIYRYLNLVYTPSVAFKSIQVDPVVDEKGRKGSLSIKSDFLNYVNEPSAKLNIKIFNPKGKLVKETDKTIHSFKEQEIFSMDIPKPSLWSPDKPDLYSCELTLSTSKGSMTCEEVFGFRHFEFKNKGPFYLNGKRLLLKGTHRHEDHAGVAAAMTEDLIIKEMEMMKEMGVNFIRLGHYQQSRIVLEQCDRLGILVWEEIPWCRGGLGNEVYKEQARRMLTNMINQHRNHPSVILWGLGNENDWPNDFPEFDREAIRVFMKELHDLSHKLDGSRLTAIRRCGFCKDIVDVYSPSIWPGWYRGYYTDYEKYSHQALEEVNHFLHVEWGGDSHAYRYEEIPYDISKSIPLGGDSLYFEDLAKKSKDIGYKSWNETYICDMIDWHLKEQETMPWLTGAAYWPFKDFSTPVRPNNPVPYMNQKGVAERDLTPKDAFYVFQSYWTDKPMIHIFGQNWQTRWGGADEQKLMKVYSNCDEVELFLNGVNLGKKKRNSQDFPAAGLRWISDFKEGKNTLKALGKKGKAIVEDTQEFMYEVRPFGKEARLNVRVEDIGSDQVWVKAELIDENGVVCLESRKYIEFESVGDGSLIKNQGTSTGANKVQAYNGRAKIKFNKSSGQSTIAVKSEGLETVLIPIK